MRVITNAELRANGLKAYHEGRLTAQNDGECRYREVIGGKACCCVIGASLTDAEVLETGETERESTTVGYIPKSASFSFEDLTYARKLQDAHDSWASTFRTASGADRKKLIEVEEKTVLAYLNSTQE